MRDGDDWAIVQFVEVSPSFEGEVVVNGRITVGFPPWIAFGDITFMLLASSFRFFLHLSIVMRADGGKPFCFFAG